MSLVCVGHMSILGTHCTPFDINCNLGAVQVTQRISSHFALHFSYLYICYKVRKTQWISLFFNTICWIRNIQMTQIIGCYYNWCVLMSHAMSVHLLPDHF